VANWLDPRNRNYSGWAGLGNVHIGFRHRDPRVARDNVHAEGLQERNVGYAPDLETADRLAREALTALAAERGEKHDPRARLMN